MRILPAVFVLFLGINTLAQNANVAPVQPEPAKSTLRARVFYEDTGRPVKRTSVILMTKGGGGREASGITDADGKLEIRDLKAGKYYAVVNAPGVVTPLAYIDISRSRADSFEEQLAGFPPIVVNGVTDVVTEIPAKRGGAIGGRISYANGDPAIGVRVEILRKVGEEHQTSIPNLSVIGAILSGGSGVFQTDDRGMYRFAGLPAGEYIIKTSENVVHSTNRRGYDDGFESMFTRAFSLVTVFFQDAFEKSKAQPVAVEFGQEVVEINIVLPDRGLHLLEGKVVAAKDKLPIRNARLSIQRVGDEMIQEERYGQGRQVSYSGEEGEWKFVELPAGKYKLTVEAESSEFDEKAKVYGHSANNPAEYAANVITNAVANYAAGRGADKPPARKFARQVKEFTIDDKDLTAQVIELTHGATISGTVTLDDKKETLPSSVTVAVTNVDSEVISSASVYTYDYTGEGVEKSKAKDFKIEGVASGRISFTIHAADNDFYVKKATAGGTDLLKDTVDIKDAEDLRNVQIVLAKDTGTLKGTIIDAEKQPVAGLQITLVPTDPAKYRNPSFYRSVRSDENGEFEVKLPPFEYAAVSLPVRIASKRREELYKWLAEAVKQAQTFKIEAGQTTKATIKITTEKVAR